MPQGVPENVPNDGLTTRQRHDTPVLAVHTGDGKGKSTAAFGMAMRAWNAGLSVGVFQFVKSAKWRVGEESALLALGEVHAATGKGAPVEWHKMGQGWSWLRANAGDADDHAAAAAAELEPRSPQAHRTDPRLLRPRRVHPIRSTGDGSTPTPSWPPRRQARPPACGDHRPPRTQALVDAADLVTEMRKIAHPMDQGRKGQKGIEW